MSSKLPKGWKSVNLGDVAKVESGYAFKSGEFIRNGIPIVRINNLDKNGVNLDFNISYSSDFKQIDKYKIEFGDILIGMSGSIGKVSIYKNKCIALLNQRVGNVKPINQNELSKLYLYYFLRSEMFVREISKSANGCIISNISSKDICNVKFNVPDMQEQQKIVSILEIAENTIKKRTEQIEALDELVKSRFIEMFGDPVRNPKGWKIEKLENISSVGSSKRVFVDELVDEGIPFYRGTEIGALSTGEHIQPTLFITKEHYNSLKESTGVPVIGDLLMPSICPDGRIWIVKDNQPFYFKDGRVLWIHLEEKNINSIYLKHMLREKFIRDYNKIASGTTFAELKIFALKGLDISIPPIELQNQFADFVNQIDKLKSQMENSLKELEDNFKSLMQKAFKGELF